MKKIYLWFFTLLCLGSVLPCFGIEEVGLEVSDAKEAQSFYDSVENQQFQLFGKLTKKEIYSAGNVPELKRNSTAAVDVITSQDIENQNRPSLSALLNQLTGVTVQKSGASGDPVSFRIRGNDRVRVTLDGIRVDSPSDNKFYLQNYISDDIERIEVIRGPQGNMSGAEASGGLVGMFTRQGEGKPSFDYYSEGGSFGTSKQRVTFDGGDEKKDYYIGTTWFRTDGGTRIDNGYGGVERVKNDYYKNFNAVGNFGYRLLEGTAELREIVRVSNSRAGVGVQDWAGTLVQDPNNYIKNLDVTSTTIFNHQPNEYYDSSTRFGVYNTKYNLFSLDDNNGFVDYRVLNQGTRLNFISQHNLNYKDWNKFSVGYNMEYNKYSSFSEYYSWIQNPDKYGGHSLQNDIFLSDSVNIKDIFFLKGGARLIDNSLFGTFITPNGSAAVVLPTFKIKDSYSKVRASWGQSINNPTFSQMFGSLAWVQNPNPNLIPEKLTGWDVGFEQSFFDEKLGFEFGYFNNKYKDYIGWVLPGGFYPGTHINVDKAKINGYEAGIKWQPCEKFRTSLNYTFTNSEDEATGFVLPAVPKNRVNYTVYYTPNKAFTMFSTLEGATNRAYSTNPTPKMTGGYVDVAFGGKLKLISYKKMNVNLTGQVYNLLNQRISMYKGYYQPGIHFMAGAFIEFNELGKKEKL